MDHDETLACLAEVGIEVDGEFSLDVLKGALRNRYGARERSVREVFDMLDEDDSGALDVEEGQMAAAILGGVLMEKEALAEKFAAIDTDGDGTLSFEEFESWWTEHAASEEALLEQTWAATELQRVQRGRATRTRVDATHDYTLAKARAKRDKA